MKFYIQQGYGMMRLNKEFADKYEDLGVITAPRAMQRNADVSRLSRHAKALKKKGVTILFDPEFYDPRTNMEKILKYPYFEFVENFRTNEFNEYLAEDFIKKVIDYQIYEMNVDKIIIPNTYINSIDQNWYDMQEEFLKSLENYETELDIYMSLPLGPDVIKNKDMFDKLIGQCISYPVKGFYVVLKAPQGDFLIDDEEYLYSVLDALISLEISEKEILLGYANQQSLIYAAAGVESIATGNFRNVRSFDPDNYTEDDDDNILQRATWYYDGNSLSEFRPQHLDLAYRRRLKDYFGPSNEYSKELLNSEKPSAIPWGEGKAFRHYLVTIREQWLKIESIDRSKRIDYIIEMLIKVEEHITDLQKKGFRIGRRAFNQDILDSCLSALSAIKVDRKYDLLNL